MSKLVEPKARWSLRSGEAFGILLVNSTGSPAIAQNHALLMEYLFRVTLLLACRAPAEPCSIGFSSRYGLNHLPVRKRAKRLRCTI
jgi:hypothetical protein